MFRCFRAARGQIVLLAALLLAVYLVVWHGQHLAAALPVVVLLACPLMHLFMHGGHGGHGHHRGTRSPQAAPDARNATVEDPR